MKEFTKDDLQVNDIVTTREGNMYIVHESNGKLFAIREQGYLAFYDYNNDLTLKKGAEFNIVKVQRPDEAYQLTGRAWVDAPVIWERKEKEKAPILSEAEYHILNSLSKEWEWIARGEDGSLFLYDKKPYKYGSFWKYTSAYIELDIYEHLFPCVQWEDDEPWKITKLLKRYEEEHNHGN